MKNNRNMKVYIGSEREGNLPDLYTPDFFIPEDSEGEWAVFPGFCDVHVHFREPGFCYKEDMASGSRAAAHGGYTAVCTMPNLDPVPDSLPHLEAQEEAIREKAVVEIYPYGAITVGEKGEMLSDMESLSPRVIAFSDDGRGVQSEERMRQAMTRARALGKIIAAHCEVNELLRGGYIHDGAYASAHGHRGISSESEYREIERDIALAKETGAAFHVCHVSTAESVALIRKAKREGVDITCETGPHYLILDENDLKEDGAYKMNPPLRSARDRIALLEGILDGTIDMIATDHAPHSAEEKSRGLEKSAFGIVGLETAFPLLYTHLVRGGILTLDRLVDLLSVNPRKRFGIPPSGYSVWALDDVWEITEESLLSRGKATPFLHTRVYGKNQMTVLHKKIVYQAEKKGDDQHA